MFLPIRFVEKFRTEDHRIGVIKSIGKSLEHVIPEDLEIREPAGNIILQHAIQKNHGIIKTDRRVYHKHFLEFKEFFFFIQF